MSAICYLLWRQDDNGQRFIVGRYVARADAEQMLRQLTCVQHKQIYWIEEGEPEDETGR